MTASHAPIFCRRVSRTVRVSGAKVVCSSGTQPSVKSASFTSCRQLPRSTVAALMKIVGRGDAMEHEDAEERRIVSPDSPSPHPKTPMSVDRLKLILRGAPWPSVFCFKSADHTAVERAGRRATQSPGRRPQITTRETARVSGKRRPRFPELTTADAVEASQAGRLPRFAGEPRTGELGGGRGTVSFGFNG